MLLAQRGAAKAAGPPWHRCMIHRATLPGCEDDDAELSPLQRRPVRHVPASWSSHVGLSLSRLAFKQGHGEGAALR
jgi:hypothetical protein